MIVSLLLEAPKRLLLTSAGFIHPVMQMNSDNRLRLVYHYSVITLIHVYRYAELIFNNRSIALFYQN